jgi:hypothetical protein
MSHDTLWDTCIAGVFYHPVVIDPVHDYCMFSKKKILL